MTLYKIEVQEDQHNKGTRNLIEGKVGNSLEWVGTGDIILNWTPIAQVLISTIDSRDLMKLKTQYVHMDLLQTISM